MAQVITNKTKPSFSLALNNKINPPLLMTPHPFGGQSITGKQNFTNQTSTPKYATTSPTKKTTGVPLADKIVTPNTTYSNTFPKQSLGAAAITSQQNTATPSTPDFKSFSDADWIKYQANKAQTASPTSVNSSITPSASSSVVATPSPTPPPAVSPYAPATQVASPQASGLYGQVVNDLSNVGTDKVTGNLKKIKDLEDEYARQAAGLESSGIGLQYGQGMENTLRNSVNSRLNAAQTGLSNALTEQGQVISAKQAAAGLAAPQPYGLTTQPYNPLTDTYGGGGSGGAINRSIQASNIGSASDFQTKIQNTQASASAADANFDILNSYAQGFAGDTPVTNGLKQKYGTTVQGNQAVAGFQAQLQSVRQAWTNIVGGDAVSAIPDNITPNQLKQVQQALKNSAQNNIVGYQNQLRSLQGGGNSGGGGSTPNDPLGIR